LSNEASSSASGNLALGKKAFVSSNQSVYFGELVLDGDTTTRWSADFTGDPQWIYIDLGKSYMVNHVILNWEYAYAKGYKIQTSGSGTTWTDVFSTTEGDGNIDDIWFTPKSAKYVRMYGTERGTPYSYSLWEFDIYAATDLVAPQKPLGLAAEVLTSASIALSWTASPVDDGVAGYYVYEGLQMNGESVTPSYTADGLKPAAEYVFRIAAYDSARNISLRSDPVTATTLSTFRVDNKEDESFLFYPNPVTNGILSLMLPEGWNQDISIAIADVTGRLVYRDAIHTQTQGTSICINISSLSAGSYIVSANDGERVDKQIIIKK
jgi:hypothetical protein